MNINWLNAGLGVGVFLRSYAETQTGDFMNRQEIFKWVKEQYDTDPDYPWQDANAVLRHWKNRKWYGLIMKVGRDKLGLSGVEEIEVLNLKCDPEMIGFLRTRPGFLPAYHMNKMKWISVLLDGTVSDEEIRNLIHISYGLTEPKKR